MLTIVKLLKCLGRKLDYISPSESTDEVIRTFAVGEKQHPVMDMVCALKYTKNRY